MAYSRDMDRVVQILKDRTDTRLQQGLVGRRAAVYIVVLSTARDQDDEFATMDGDRATRYDCRGDPVEDRRPSLTYPSHRPSRSRLARTGNATDPCSFISTPFARLIRWTFSAENSTYQHGEGAGPPPYLDILLAPAKTPVDEISALAPASPTSTDGAGHHGREEENEDGSSVAAAPTLNAVRPVSRTKKPLSAGGAVAAPCVFHRGTPYHFRTMCLVQVEEYLGRYYGRDWRRPAKKWVVNNMGNPWGEWTAVNNMEGRTAAARPQHPVGSTEKNETGADQIGPGREETAVRRNKSGQKRVKNRSQHIGVHVVQTDQEA